MAETILRTSKNYFEMKKHYSASIDPHNIDGTPISVVVTVHTVINGKQVCQYQGRNLDGIEFEHMCKDLCSYYNVQIVEEDPDTFWAHRTHEINLRCDNIKEELKRYHEDTNLKKLQQELSDFLAHCKSFIRDYQGNLPPEVQAAITILKEKRTFYIETYYPNLFTPIKPV